MRFFFCKHIGACNQIKLRLIACKTHNMDFHSVGLHIVNWINIIGIGGSGRFYKFPYHRYSHVYTKQTKSPPARNSHRIILDIIKFKYPALSGRWVGRFIWILLSHNKHSNGGGAKKNFLLAISWNGYSSLRCIKIVLHKSAFEFEAKKKF